MGGVLPYQDLDRFNDFIEVVVLICNVQNELFEKLHLFSNFVVILLFCKTYNLELVNLFQYKMFL